MSYYFRQQVMKRGWDPEAHPRGKTTPESNAGSFAPSGMHPEVAAEVRALQVIGYRWLAEGRPFTRKQFEATLQERMRDAMGAGHEKHIAAMADRIWNEYHSKGPHRYFEPVSWQREGWAVKVDVML